MNWISNVVRPKIRSFLRRETPENLWIKCPETGQLVFYKDVEANQFVIPSLELSHAHQRAGAAEEHVRRWRSIEDLPLPDVPVDPLRFRDERRYADRLKDARTKTGLQDAVKVGVGTLEGLPVTIGVQDFDFMGGSLGMAAGEAVIKGLETAVAARDAVHHVRSLGRRAHAGRHPVADADAAHHGRVQMLREAKKPYIVVLTNPTTGGVTASYAMLGDVHIAEPGALIGFAGPRVIEQTIREKLPEGFQRAEYLAEHGMVDMVVHRHKMRATLARLCRLLTKAPRRAGANLPVPAHASRACPSSSAHSPSKTACTPCPAISLERRPRHVDQDAGSRGGRSDA